MIYEELFRDLIDELSDSLFAAFTIYDNIYDYTASHMESHVGKTGLTPILRTCKQVHNEALSLLCEKAEFVVTIMDDEDLQDKERSPIRFSAGSHHLGFARNLKVNFSLGRQASNCDHFRDRILRFLEMIDYGKNLPSLSIVLFDFLPPCFDAEEVDKILCCLGTLKTKGRSINVYLGNVNEVQLSDERYTLFLDAIDGNNMGRDHHALLPTHYESEVDDSEIGYPCGLFD
ncbi:hypothetical protein B0H63DRAFT_549100 [Podospora didyma]|uniref:Uncharacterized protein n=1 Tax=Podospora didyma TaxID=330526 RepID=A0AAE0KF32_9PEZI|nr:hypothetical protein B0H63DRAFT_549100 [Podospora didyma]